MASGNYEEKFERARSAYSQKDFAQAGELLDDILEENPEEPSALLLKGHIYVHNQKYDLARNTYQEVLSLTDRENLIQLANQGLAGIEDQNTLEINEDDNEDIF